MKTYADDISESTEKLTCKTPTFHEFVKKAEDELAGKKFAEIFFYGKTVETEKSPVCSVSQNCIVGFPRTTPEMTLFLILGELCEKQEAQNSIDGLKSIARGAIALAQLAASMARSLENKVARDAMKAASYSS